jgi:ABC-2 type transport system ATP-binding protein
MIVVDHVTKYYGAHAAVRDLDFRIAEGECVGFLGLNGAGKTTTLRLLACLLLPTSGRVTVKGLDAEEEPHEIRKLLGFLPDAPPVYPEMRVGAFLRFAGKLRGMTEAEVDKRIPEVFDAAGLGDVADDAIGALSHGYRQRVGIGQAIIHRPALLILDEPIQGLDPVQIVEMREMIRRLRGKHTILLSTHILGEIKETCDRILMLHQGRITAQGSEAELAERFGYGVVNIEVVARGGETALREALEKVAGVSITSLGPVETTYRNAPEGSIRAQVRATTDVREELAKSVVQAGLGLLVLSRVSTGLENIFVKLSQDAQEGDRS